MIKDSNIYAPVLTYLLNLLQQKIDKMLDKLHILSHFSQLI